MRFCTRCGSLVWDNLSACPACGATGLSPVGSREPDLRSALLLVCAERPMLMDQFGALRSALSDIWAPIASDPMLMAALETALPIASAGEGYVRATLKEGRHPYPEALVDEVTSALVDGLRLVDNPQQFAADPGSSWKLRYSKVGQIVQHGWEAAAHGDWATAASRFDEATKLDAACSEAWLGAFLAQRTWLSVDDAVAYARERVGAIEQQPGRTVRVSSQARDRWIASAGSVLEADAKRIALALLPDANLVDRTSAYQQAKTEIEGIFSKSPEWARAVATADPEEAKRLAGVRAEAVAVVDNALRTKRVALDSAGKALDAKWSELEGRANADLEQARVAREEEERARERAHLEYQRAIVRRQAERVSQLVQEAERLAGRIPAKRQEIMGGFGAAYDSQLAAQQAEVDRLQHEVETAQKNLKATEDALNSNASTTKASVVAGAVTLVAALFWFGPMLGGSGAAAEEGSRSVGFFEFMYLNSFRMSSPFWAGRFAWL